MRTWQKVIFLSASLVFVFFVIKAQSATPTIVGNGKCKFCHKEEFAAWGLQKHAKAWASLKPEEQAKAECVACHSTGGAAQPNVGCESCHGPGSEYAKPTLMNKDKWKADPAGSLKAAQAAGLTIPNEKVCVKCHNSKSPNFKSFDFAKAKVTIKHWK